jgi:hypothetical protein
MFVFILIDVAEMDRVANIFQSLTISSDLNQKPTVDQKPVTGSIVDSLVDEIEIEETKPIANQPRRVMTSKKTAITDDKSRESPFTTVPTAFFYISSCLLFRSFSSYANR